MRVRLCGAKRILECLIVLYGALVGVHVWWSRATIMRQEKYSTMHKKPPFPSHTNYCTKTGGKSELHLESSAIRPLRLIDEWHEIL